MRRRKGKTDMNLRASIIRLSLSAALVAASLAGAGWKWHRTPF